MFIKREFFREEVKVEFYVRDFIEGFFVMFERVEFYI